MVGYRLKSSRRHWRSIRINEPRRWDYWYFRWRNCWICTMKLSDIPFEIWIGLLTTSGYLLSSQILLSNLSKFDSDLFNSLGRPHIIWNSTPKNNYLFSKWIFDFSFKANHEKIKIWRAITQSFLIISLSWIVFMLFNFINLLL